MKREGISDCARIKVGSYTLGGAVGEFPTALFGTVFSGNQVFLKNPEEGLFDADEALRQIEENATVCRNVGTPFMLDVVAETEQAVRSELDFVINRTDLPFLIDASDEDIRMDGLRKAREHSALDRVVYNSISPDSPDEEFESLKKDQPAAIVVSAMDPMNFGVDSAMKVVDEIKARLNPDLHGRLLLDVGFLDEASIGISCRVAQQLRRATSLPVGGAVCNGLYMWETLRERGEGAFVAALAAALGYCAAYGLDFLFAGPIRLVKDVVPGLAACDVYNRYSLMNDAGHRNFSPEHPIREMF